MDSLSSCAIQSGSLSNSAVSRYAIQMKATDDKPPTQADQDDRTFGMNGDINTAVALRAQYAIETPRPSKRRHKKAIHHEEVEPLIDNTASLTLHSKKTERIQKRQQKKSRKAAMQPPITSISSLPTELLTEVLSYLRPSDVYCFGRTSRDLHDLVTEHGGLVARDIVKRRYWTLYRCFPLPVALEDVPADAHSALLNERRQEMLNIHRKSYYQHVQMIDSHAVCTCMTCVFAWNNLCLLIDLNHWQRNLERREPIPMIARGTNPPWNQELLERNANFVRRAMTDTLMYGLILEKHLSTITGTIRRSGRWKPKGAVESTPRLYTMTEADILSGTDAFLERRGPPSYDFPFHRDNYYAVEAYVPNRKWSPESKRWHYYALPPAQHERDLEWVRATDRAWASRAQSQTQKQTTAGVVTP